MPQPTLHSMTLNTGSGGLGLAYDLVDDKVWQSILVGYSTGDNAANVVMADTGLPVVAQTGATWAVTQSGTWNINNLSGTVSLPTGASTSANQTTGNTALAAIKTAVELIDDAVLADGGTPSKSVLAGGRYDASPRAIANGKQGALALTPEAAAFAAAADQTDFAYDGNTKCTIKRWSSVEAASGTNTLMVAVASKKFRILSWSVLATSATPVSFYFEDADGTAVWGSAAGKATVDLDGGGGPAGVVFDENKGGWFETPTVNKDFEINLSGAVAVIVTFTYIEVT